MINMLPILAQTDNITQILTGIENISKLGAIGLAVVVSLGVILIAWTTSRSSNKLASAMLPMFGDSLKRTDILHQKMETSAQLDQERHHETMQALQKTAQTQIETVTVLKELVGAVGTMKDEVVAMRSENHGMETLRQQIDELQKTVQRQAKQLEDQALEISTLRESNAALMDNLETERKARTQAEIQLSKERDIARQNEERNTKAVQLLKDQFNALQKEFDQYKAKMNDKTNKEATLKNDLSQHSEQSDPTNE